MGDPPWPCGPAAGLEARGRQRGEDVAAPEHAVAAHVQEPEGDAQAPLRAGGDLGAVEDRNGRILGDFDGIL